MIPQDYIVLYSISKNCSQQILTDSNYHYSKISYIIFEANININNHHVQYIIQKHTS